MHRPIETTVKLIFCVPFISRILQPWWLCENNGQRIFEMASFTSKSVIETSENAEIKGVKIMGFTVYNVHNSIAVSLVESNIVSIFFRSNRKQLTEFCDHAWWNWLPDFPSQFAVDPCCPLPVSSPPNASEIPQKNFKPVLFQLTDHLLLCDAYA